MSAELALSFKLKTDSVVQSKCSTGNQIRVFLNKRPQKFGLPAILVRRSGTNPNATKDGPSELDQTRVQVLLYVGDLDTEAYKLEARIRAICDRPSVSEEINGVYLESSAFEDDDMFSEFIEDKEVNVFEHIYKTLIKR